MRCRKRSEFVALRMIFKVTLIAIIISLAFCLLFGLTQSLSLPKLRLMASWPSWIWSCLDMSWLALGWLRNGPRSNPAREEAPISVKTWPKSKMATSCDLGKERDYFKPNSRQKAREMTTKTKVTLNIILSVTNSLRFLQRMVLCLRNSWIELDKLIPSMKLTQA